MRARGFLRIRAALCSMIRPHVDDGVRLIGQFRRRPASSAVGGALNRAALARDKVAVADEDRIGIIRLQRHSAAIRDRVAIAEAWKPVQRPGLALVNTAPYTVGR